MVLTIFVSNNLVFGQQQWGGAQDSTGSIFRLGNVGIGTPNPAAMLHLKNSGSLPTLFFEGDTSNLAVPKSQPMLFGHWDGTVFTECLRINPGGRLGIGTKEKPRAQLEIKSEGGDKSTLRVYAYPRPDDPDDPMARLASDVTMAIEPGGKPNFPADDPMVVYDPDLSNLSQIDPGGKPIFPAFGAANLRRYGQAGYFSIINSGNGSPALTATTDGTGPAGSFLISNANSSTSALHIRTMGTGHALEMHGPENTGTTAALKITSPGQRMLLDGNEIDAVGDGLYLNNNSREKVVVPVLEITSGSDLAEPFEIEGTEIVQPGMVVTIDPEQPGKLRIAGKACDRTVAGIISGANGLNPGLTLKQADSIGDGTHPIALTGRVYCWADASNGSIQPGDLLTTSDTPGHAMKVANYAVAQGAIIGKAMTALEKGKGLVLVLVSLQ